MKRNTLLSEVSVLGHPRFSPCHLWSTVAYSQMSHSTPTTSSSWKLDKFILIWIKVSVSTSIHTLLLQCQSAYEAFKASSTNVSLWSRRSTSTPLSQEDSQQVYFWITSPCEVSADSLASAKSPLQDSELVNHILDGLKEFIISFHLRQTTSFDNLYDLFI